VGSVLGTAAYLAPEQARGEEAGPAADIYALAVVTYQLLSGRLPYEATSLSELTLKQQREAPTPLDAVNPEVSPSLARAVARGLALDPAGRYESAIAMAQALRAGARGIDPPAADVPDRATEATQMLERQSGDETEATRVLGAHDPVTPAPVRPARQAPAERRRRDRAAAPARQRRKRRLGPLIVLLILAGLIGAGGIIAADQLGGRPQLRKVVAEDAPSAIDEVKQFVEDNTR
jgi:serine/threonine-protein kinase